MSKQDYYKGLNAHFTEQENSEKVAVQSLGKKARKAKNKRAKQDADIDSMYFDSTLNPINRYKHNHKLPAKVKAVDPRLGTHEVTKTTIKHGKRIIKIHKKAV